LITDADVKKILLKDLNFNAQKIEKLDYFAKNLIIHNKKHNFISKNSEKQLWLRHILDSAQLIKFIDHNNCNGIADLGTGGGFPGIILAIYYQSFNFHVKLYEKSPVKSAFLTNISNKLGLKCKIICNDIRTVKIDSDHIVCRAFRKIPYILNISRENCIKKHKIIIMKGRNAQREINNTFQLNNYKYKLENSITDNDSKIIILNVE
tara:strand:- start:65 stop:685 length:621 start_codon:yes stop_codon:yes gene_type:complete